jgi:hypothetical protein
MSNDKKQLTTTQTKKMKTLIPLFCAGLFLSSVALAQTNSSLAPEASATAAAKKEYTCPMHPDVVKNKPGKCPKCGMTLVEK